jgi:glycosyltransferase involved in cell wall biosynthesis
MELVSIIIPTFNSSKYIHDAIKSACTQTYRNIEVVVVDDGSTDDTVDIVQEVLKRSDINWQVLRLEKNGGASAARNAGILAAKGAWIQFLDSDDLLMPGKIELEMAVAAKAAEDVAVVYSPWNFGFLEQGMMKWLGPVKQPFVGGGHPIMCLAGRRPLLGSSLVRRSALNAVGGLDERLRFWECEELNVRLAKVGAFVLVESQSPQYLWRMRPDEIYIGGPGSRYNSKDVSLSWIAQAIKAADKHRLEDLGLSKDDRLMLLSECTLWGRLLYSQHRTAFSEYLRLATMLDPQIAPVYPRYISALSRWVGYEAAERVAKLTRQPKVWLRTALCRLGLRRPNMIIELT